MARILQRHRSPRNACTRSNPGLRAAAASGALAGRQTVRDSGGTATAGRALLAQAGGHRVDQLGRTRSQSFGQAEQRGERWTGLAELQFGHEGPVQSALEGQGLLAQASRVPARPNLGREGS